MTNTNEKLKLILSFEKKLKAEIKEIFLNYINSSTGFERNLNVDFYTYCELNALMNPIGMGVYGMSITPNEFKITFEFKSQYNSFLYEKMPRHCEICFINDSAHGITMEESTLKSNWHLSIKDKIFNHRTTTVEEIKEILNEMEQVLMISKISN